MVASHILNKSRQKKKREPSLAVQWLRLPLPLQRVWVQSLVGELKSHMTQGQKPEHKTTGNIATNSIKTLKMIHIKKKKNPQKNHVKKKTESQNIRFTIAKDEMENVALGVLCKRLADTKFPNLAAVCSLRLGQCQTRASFPHTESPARGRFRSSRSRGELFKKRKK